MSAPLTDADILKDPPSTYRIVRDISQGAPLGSRRAWSIELEYNNGRSVRIEGTDPVDYWSAIHALRASGARLERRADDA